MDDAPTPSSAMTIAHSKCAPRPDHPPEQRRREHRDQHARQQYDTLQSRPSGKATASITSVQPLPCVPGRIRLLKMNTGRGKEPRDGRESTPRCGYATRHRRRPAALPTRPPLRSCTPKQTPRQKTDRKAKESKRAPKDCAADSQSEHPYEEAEPRYFEAKSPTQ